MNWTICRVETTSSTNDDAVAAVIAGEPDGLVIHAMSQAAGRGRHGRTWESPVGNLYCSVVLRHAFDGQSIGQMSFVAALALYDTVRHYLPQANVALKWPNDVLVEGKKISGILLEAGSGWMVVGMGMNVKNHPEAALYPTTSLHAAGCATAEVDDVLSALLKHFGHWYDIFKTQGFADIRAAWINHALRGEMTVKLPQETVLGAFIDLGMDGRLCLRLPDGTEKYIATGDVFPNN